MGLNVASGGNLTLPAPNYNQPYTVVYSMLLPASTGGFLPDVQGGSTSRDLVQFGGALPGFSLMVRAGGADAGISGGTTTWDEWHQYVLRRVSESMAEVHYDGQLRVQNPKTVTTRSPLATSIRFDPGKFAFIKVWNRALTDEEMADELAFGKATHRTGLWGEYLFTGSTNLLNDTSGNNRHATAVNGSYIADPTSPPFQDFPWLELPTARFGGLRFKDVAADAYGTGLFYDGPDIPSGNSPYTIMFFLSDDRVATEDAWSTCPFMFVSQPPTPTNLDRHYYNRSGVTRLYSYINGSSSGAGYPPVPARDTWVHLTYRRQSATDWTVFTGPTKTTVTTDVSARVPLTSFTIWGGVGGDGNMTGANGRLAAIKMWDIALSDADIAIERESCTPVTNLDRLWGFWPLTGGRSFYLEDYSGNDRALKNAYDTSEWEMLPIEEAPPYTTGGCPGAEEEAVLPPGYSIVSSAGPMVLIADNTDPCSPKYKWAVQVDGLYA